MNYGLPFESNFSAQLRSDGITVYSVEGCGNILHTHSRKDFYRISLLCGSGTVYFEDRSVEIKGSVLLVTKPGVICSWDLGVTPVPSYTCVITREFLNTGCFRWVTQCSRFSADEPEVYILSPDQSSFLRSLFQKMIGARESNYTFRSELIQDQLCVLFHTAMRLNASENYIEPTFMLTPMSRHIELVEMMFPPEAQVLHFN